MNNDKRYYVITLCETEGEREYFTKYVGHLTVDFVSDDANILQHFFQNDDWDEFYNDGIYTLDHDEFRMASVSQITVVNEDSYKVLADHLYSINQ